MNKDQKAKRNTWLFDFETILQLGEAEDSAVSPKQPFASESVKSK